MALLGINYNYYQDKKSSNKYMFPNNIQEYLFLLRQLVLSLDPNRYIHQMHQKFRLHQDHKD